MKDQSRQENCNGCQCGLCCTKIINLGVTLNRVEILRDVNLHIHCGDLTAIIGPNGSGKTTLLKAVLGEIPHRGRLEFMDPKNKKTGRPLIGYVPQRLDFDGSSPMTVLDFFGAAYTSIPVWFGHSQKVKQRVKKSLVNVEADHLIKRRLGALSGGELQRVLLALALDPIPNLLLLDEPVSGIDQNGIQIFYKLVSKLRKDYDLSIILVSHNLDMVKKYADRVVFLRDKTIECCGTPSEVFSNPKARETFGSDWISTLIKASEEEEVKHGTMV